MKWLPTVRSRRRHAGRPEDDRWRCRGGEDPDRGCGRATGDQGLGPQERGAVVEGDRAGHGIRAAVGRVERGDECHVLPVEGLRRRRDDVARVRLGHVDDDGQGGRGGCSEVDVAGIHGSDRVAG